ncbi:MAG: LysR family transcriptional regulator [Nitratireductor sp.]|nr:LysR family transcriptional regulator [Nitratireductor sp.]
MPVAPPRPRPPPLNALRAFEAAARLGGFSSAARELCVTQGAVAQQIKQLEDWAGAKLFERHSRGVRLSPAGRAVLPALGEAFDLLGAVSQTLRRHGAEGTVRIATLPAIAQLWLSPRLPRIRPQGPGLAVSVTALETPPNLTREPYDLSIFYVEEEKLEPGMTVIGRDVIYPVAAPQLAAGITATGDLAGQVFLHDAVWQTDWQVWLDHATPGHGIEPAGPAFSLYALAVEEAKNGAGVLIGHDALVGPLVERGELAAPFRERLHLPRLLVIEVAAALRGKKAVETVLGVLGERSP